jgi:hypothetical protein
MFEGYTLVNQLEDRVRRGWDLSKFGALPDPSAEVVIYRRPRTDTQIFDYEILEAFRVKGIEDCRNRWQGKWGTQVRSGQDRTSRHAIQRAMKEFFGWELELDKFPFVATMGPWIHRATVAHMMTQVTMTVYEDQGEVTPWKGDIYCLDATELELPATGGYTAMEQTHWVTFRDLIESRGQDASYLYWSVIAACIPTMFKYDPPHHNLTPYFGPGEYRLWWDAYW